MSRGAESLQAVEARPYDLLGMAPADRMSYSKRLRETRAGSAQHQPALLRLGGPLHKTK